MTRHRGAYALSLLQYREHDRSFQNRSIAAARLVIQIVRAAPL
ncbi:hypothetical protein I546_5489 [Mycobacterium kansasii 732]|nr:hypothetical protein I546_5489 [Mycobacterium kansasii 732]